MLSNVYQFTAGWASSAALWLAALVLAVVGTVTGELVYLMWAILASVAAGTLTVRTCLLFVLDRQREAFTLGYEAQGYGLRTPGDRARPGDPGTAPHGLPSISDEDTGQRG